MTNKKQGIMELCKKKKYLFDYDGVLVPDITAEQLKRAYSTAECLLSTRYNLPMADAIALLRKLREEKFPGIREPLIAVMHREFPELSVPEVFNAVFGSYKNDERRFDYDKDLAIQLRDLYRGGIDSFVFTNNIEKEVISSMQAKGIAQYFSDVIGCDHLNGVFKPSPEAFNLALKRMSSTTEEVVFVDNSAANVTAAVDMGIFSVYITGDRLDTAEHVCANLIFATVTDFLKIGRYMLAANKSIRIPTSPLQE
jgi:FMN phosphatase YigB (HAD superfamily)